jgi:hypothetical protein
VDISEVAIRKLDQKARQLDLALDLFALDAKEYPFTPAYFDLIVMFYHFDRDICPKVLSTLKAGGILICKSSLSGDSYEGAAPASIRPLARNENPADAPRTAGDAPSRTACTRPWCSGVCREEAWVREITTQNRIGI